MNSVSLSRFKTQEASSFFALEDRKRDFCNSLNMRNVDFEFFNLKRCDTSFRYMHQINALKTVNSMY